jgi:predicted Zn finger-like uncharacterized protein
MIDFTCPQCGSPFTVSDHLAGRRARCRKCQTAIEIPAPASGSSAGSSIGAKISPRHRRLLADFEQMKRAFTDFPFIRIRAAHGDPVETYELEYFVRGLARMPGRTEPIERSYHCVEIKLGLDYPRLGPRCRMLTPVFHPNIEPATICIGDHWTAGERLVDLCVRIGEMIAFQAYNIQSPLDAEAAMWADLHVKKLPVDDRNLRPGENA